MPKRKGELCGYYYPRFAWYPKRIDGKWLWFKRFYRKCEHLHEGGCSVREISCEEYCFLKLSGKLIPDYLRAYKQDTKKQPPT